MLTADDATDVGVGGLDRATGDGLGRGSEVLVTGNTTVIAVRIRQLTRILVDKITGWWLVCLLGV